MPTAPTAAPAAVAIDGTALREIRKRAGVSILDLAEAVGVKRSYVTKLELGHSRRVSPPVYNRLVTSLAIASVQAERDRDAAIRAALGGRASRANPAAQVRRAEAEIGEELRA